MTNLIFIAPPSLQYLSIGIPTSSKRSHAWVVEFVVRRGCIGSIMHPLLLTLLPLLGKESSLEGLESHSFLSYVGRIVMHFDQLSQVCPDRMSSYPINISIHKPLSNTFIGNRLVLDETDRGQMETKPLDVAKNPFEFIVSSGTSSASSDSAEAELFYFDAEENETESHEVSTEVSGFPSVVLVCDARLFRHLRLTSTFHSNAFVDIRKIGVSVLQIFNRYCSGMITGGALSPRETLHQLWLESSLFSGGLEADTSRFGLKSRDDLLAHSKPALLSPTSSSVALLSPPSMARSKQKETPHAFGHVKFAWTRKDEEALLSGLLHTNTASFSVATGPVATSQGKAPSITNRDSDAKWLVHICKAAFPDRVPVQRSVHMYAERCVLLTFAVLLKHTNTVRQALHAIKCTRLGLEPHAIENVVRQWKVALKMRVKIASMVARGEHVGNLFTFVTNRAHILLGLRPSNAQRVCGITPEEVSKTRARLDLPPSPFLDRTSSDYADVGLVPFSLTPSAHSVQLSGEGSTHGTAGTAPSDADHSEYLDLPEMDCGGSSTFASAPSLSSRLWSKARQKLRLLCNILRAMRHLKELVKVRAQLIAANRDPETHLVRTITLFLTPDSKEAIPLSSPELTDAAKINNQFARDNGLDEEKEVERKENGASFPIVVHPPPGVDTANKSSGAHSTEAEANSSTTSSLKDGASSSDPKLEQTLKKDGGKMNDYTLQSLVAALRDQEERARRRLYGFSTVQHVAECLQNDDMLEELLRSVSLCFQTNRKFSSAAVVAANLGEAVSAENDEGSDADNDSESSKVGSGSKSNKKKSKGVVLNETHYRHHSRIIPMGNNSFAHTSEGTNQPATIVCKVPLTKEFSSFQVEILNAESMNIYVGLVPCDYALDVMPGHDPESIGYMLGKGLLCHQSPVGSPILFPAKVGDTIECGLKYILNDQDSKVYWVRGGNDALYDCPVPKGGFYPAVGMTHPCIVKITFRQNKSHQPFPIGQFQPMDRVPKSHFLVHMNSVGPSLRRPLSKLYFSLITSIMKRKEVTTKSWLHLLDLCNVDFHQSDMEYVDRFNVMTYILPLIQFSRCAELSRTKTLLGGFAEFAHPTDLGPMSSRSRTSAAPNPQRHPTGGNTTNTLHPPDTLSEVDEDTSAASGVTSSVETSTNANTYRTSTIHWGSTQGGVDDAEVLELQQKWGITFSAWALFRRIIYDVCNHSPVGDNEDVGRPAYEGIGLGSESQPNPASTTSPTPASASAPSSSSSSSSPAPGANGTFAPSTTRRPGDRSFEYMQSTESISIRQDLFSALLSQMQHILDLRVRKQGMRENPPAFAPSLSDTSIGWNIYFQSRTSGAFDAIDDSKMPRSEVSEDPEAMISTHEMDLYLNQLLWVVLRCCKCGSVREMLQASTQWVSLLTRVVTTFWPKKPTKLQTDANRISRLLAIRICRYVLPKVDPSRLSGMSAESFLLHIVNKVSLSSVILSSLYSYFGSDTVNYTDDSSTSELIALFRTLLRSPLWSDVTNDVLEQPLERIGTVSEFLLKCASGEAPSMVHTQEHMNALGDAVAALLILGGSHEPLREGARVRVRQNGKEGTGTISTLYSRRLEESDVVPTLDRSSLFGKHAWQRKLNVGDTVEVLWEDGVWYRGQVAVLAKLRVSVLVDNGKGVKFQVSVLCHSKRLARKGTHTTPDGNPIASEKKLGKGSSSNSASDVSPKKSVEKSDAALSRSRSPLRRKKGSKKRASPPLSPVSGSSEEPFSFFKHGGEFSILSVRSAKVVLDNGATINVGDADDELVAICDVPIPVDELRAPLKILEPLSTLLSSTSALPVDHPLLYETSTDGGAGVLPDTTFSRKRTAPPRGPARAHARGLWHVVDLQLRRLSMLVVEQMLSSSTLRDSFCEDIFKSVSSQGVAVASTGDGDSSPSTSSPSSCLSMAQTLQQFALRELTLPKSKFDLSHCGKVQHWHFTRMQLEQNMASCLWEERDAFKQVLDAAFDDADCKSPGGSTSIDVSKGAKGEEDINEEDGKRSEGIENDSIDQDWVIVEQLPQRFPEVSRVVMGVPHPRSVFLVGHPGTYFHGFKPELQDVSPSATSSSAPLVYGRTPLPLMSRTESMQSSLRAMDFSHISVEVCTRRLKHLEHGVISQSESEDEDEDEEDDTIKRSRAKRRIEKALGLPSSCTIPSGSHSNKLSSGTDSLSTLASIGYDEDRGSFRISNPPLIDSMMTTKNPLEARTLVTTVRFPRSFAVSPVVVASARVVVSSKSASHAGGPKSFTPSVDVPTEYCFVTTLSHVDKESFSIVIQRTDIDSSDANENSSAKTAPPFTSSFLGQSVSLSGFKESGSSSVFGGETKSAENMDDSDGVTRTNEPPSSNLGDDVAVDIVVDWVACIGSKEVPFAEAFLSQSQPIVSQKAGIHVVHVPDSNQNAKSKSKSSSATISSMLPRYAVASSPEAVRRRRKRFLQLRRPVGVTDIKKGGSDTAAASRLTTGIYESGIESSGAAETDVEEEKHTSPDSQSPPARESDVEQLSGSGRRLSELDTIDNNNNKTILSSLASLSQMHKKEKATEQIVSIPEDPEQCTSMLVDLSFDTFFEHVPLVFVTVLGGTHCRSLLAVVDRVSRRGASVFLTRTDVACKEELGSVSLHWFACDPFADVHPRSLAFGAKGDDDVSQIDLKEEDEGEATVRVSSTESQSTVDISNLPPSVIQTIGAEKALFRALKTKRSAASVNAGLVLETEGQEEHKAKDPGLVSSFEPDIKQHQSGLLGNATACGTTLLRIATVICRPLEEEEEESQENDEQKSEDRRGAKESASPFSSSFASRGLQKNAFESHSAKSFSQEDDSPGESSPKPDSSFTPSVVFNLPFTMPANPFAGSAFGSAPSASTSPALGGDDKRSISTVDSSAGYVRSPTTNSGDRVVKSSSRRVQLSRRRLKGRSRSKASALPTSSGSSFSLSPTLTDAISSPLLSSMGGASSAKTLTPSHPMYSVPTVHRFVEFPRSFEEVPCVVLVPSAASIMNAQVVDVTLNGFWVQINLFALHDSKRSELEISISWMAWTRSWTDSKLQYLETKTQADNNARKAALLVNIAEPYHLHLSASPYASHSASLVREASEISARYQIDDHGGLALNGGAYLRCRLPPASELRSDNSMQGNTVSISLRMKPNICPETGHFLPVSVAEVISGSGSSQVGYRLEVHGNRWEFATIHLFDGRRSIKHSFPTGIVERHLDVIDVDEKKDDIAETDTASLKVEEEKEREVRPSSKSTQDSETNESAVKEVAVDPATSLTREKRRRTDSATAVEEDDDDGENNEVEEDEEEEEEDKTSSLEREEKEEDEEVEGRVDGSESVSWCHLVLVCHDWVSETYMFAKDQTVPEEGEPYLRVFVNKVEVAYVDRVLAHQIDPVFSLDESVHAEPYTRSEDAGLAPIVKIGQGLVGWMQEVALWRLALFPANVRTLRTEGLLSVYNHWRHDEIYDTLMRRIVSFPCPTHLERLRESRSQLAPTPKNAFGNAPPDMHDHAMLAQLLPKSAELLGANNEVPSFELSSMSSLESEDAGFGRTRLSTGVLTLKEGTCLSLQPPRPFEAAHFNHSVVVSCRVDFDDDSSGHAPQHKKKVRAKGSGRSLPSAVIGSALRDRSDSSDEKKVMSGEESKDSSSCVHTDDVSQPRAVSVLTDGATTGMSSFEYPYTHIASTSDHDDEDEDDLPDLDLDFQAADNTNVSRESARNSQKNHSKESSQKEGDRKDGGQSSKSSIEDQTKSSDHCRFAEGGKCTHEVMPLVTLKEFGYTVCVDRGGHLHVTKNSKDGNRVTGETQFVQCDPIRLGEWFRLYVMADGGLLYLAFVAAGGKMSMTKQGLKLDIKSTPAASRSSDPLKSAGVWVGGPVTRYTGSSAESDKPTSGASLQSSSLETAASSFRRPLMARASSDPTSQSSSSIAQMESATVRASTPNLTVREVGLFATSLLLRTRGDESSFRPLHEANLHFIDRRRKYLQTCLRNANSPVPLVTYALDSSTLALGGGDEVSLRRVASEWLFFNRRVLEYGEVSGFLSSTGSSFLDLCYKLFMRGRSIRDRSDLFDALRFTLTHMDPPAPMQEVPSMGSAKEFANRRLSAFRDAVRSANHPHPSVRLESLSVVNVDEALFLKDGSRPLVEKHRRKIPGQGYMHRTKLLRLGSLDFVNTEGGTKYDSVDRMAWLGVRDPLLILYMSLERALLVASARSSLLNLLVHFTKPSPQRQLSWMDRLPLNQSVVDVFDISSPLRLSQLLDIALLRPDPILDAHSSISAVKAIITRTMEFESAKLTSWGAMQRMAASPIPLNVIDKRAPLLSNMVVSLTHLLAVWTSSFCVSKGTPDFADALRPTSWYFSDEMESSPMEFSQKHVVSPLPALILTGRSDVIDLDEDLQRCLWLVDVVYHFLRENAARLPFEVLANHLSLFFRPATMNIIIHILVTTVNQDAFRVIVSLLAFAIRHGLTLMPLHRGILRSLMDEARRWEKQENADSSTEKLKASANPLVQALVNLVVVMDVTHRPRVSKRPSGKNNSENMPSRIVNQGFNQRDVVESHTWRESLVAVVEGGSSLVFDESAAQHLHDAYSSPSSSMGKKGSGVSGGGSSRSHSSKSITMSGEQKSGDDGSSGGSTSDHNSLTSRVMNEIYYSLSIKDGCIVVPPTGEETPAEGARPPYPSSSLSAALKATRQEQIDLQHPSWFAKVRDAASLLLSFLPPLDGDAVMKERTRSSMLKKGDGSSTHMLSLSRSSSSSSTDARAHSDGGGIIPTVSGEATPWDSVEIDDDDEELLSPLTLKRKLSRHQSPTATSTSNDPNQAHFKVMYRRSPIIPLPHAVLLVRQLEEWSSNDKKAKDSSASSSSGDAPDGTYKVNDVVDCQDSVRRWYAARIIKVDTVGGRLQYLIHYEGWPSRWDEWLPFDTPRIVPYRTHTSEGTDRPARKADTVDKQLTALTDRHPPMAVTPALRDLTVLLLRFYQLNYVFSFAADRQLVQLVDLMAKEKDNNTDLSLRSNPYRFSPPEKLLQRFSLLRNLPLVAIQTRFAFLQYLNREMVSLHPLVDLAAIECCFTVETPNPHVCPDLPEILSRMRCFMFAEVKHHLSQGYMTATVESSPSSIDVKFELHGFSGENSMWATTYFMQAVAQLRHHGTGVFRIGKGQRAWSAALVGQFSQDCGGPYRTSITRMCEELMSDQLPIFTPCANAREGLGNNQHAFVPICGPISKQRRTMYEFVGCLMGLAVRSGDLLNIDLPSIVWKQLVCDTVTTDDVLAIDLLSFKMVDLIHRLEDQKGGITPEEFTQKMSSHRFVAMGSDGRVYPLIPGGERISLVWENRSAYVNALIEFRLKEFHSQVEVIRRGLCAVVPRSCLSLLTWGQLQELVCGSPEVDVDLLFEMTTYAGCDVSSPHIQNFWKILRTRMDGRDRARFLEFVWGRSRLPNTKDGFKNKFQITVYRTSNPDGYLPVTHTCFFTMELPKYSTLDIMYEKLMYAITHCVAIDMDGGTPVSRITALDVPFEEEEEE